ncbi:unnamed protein product [Agarophyton chilense]
MRLLPFAVAFVLFVVAAGAPVGAKRRGARGKPATQPQAVVIDKSNEAPWYHYSFHGPEGHHYSNGYNYRPGYYYQDGNRYRNRPDPENGYQYRNGFHFNNGNYYAYS